MALSLLQQQQQHPSFTDLQTFFDPFCRVTASTITDFNSYSGFDPMEYTNTNSPHQRVNNNSGNNNNNNNNNNGNNHQNNNGGVVLNGNGVEHHFSTVNNNQHLHNTNRAYISGYHHQHLTNDYEQVINFVDSPPNSEGSWADEHSKGSPGPQIIEVQSLYTTNNNNSNHSNNNNNNCVSRKRRMDWDSLDISQGGGNTATQGQSSAIAHKIPHLSGGNSSDEQNSNSNHNNNNNSNCNNNNNNHNHTQQQQDKEKHKKEKLSGRGSWTDDIDFDLNAEFNSNSYLNNSETFLSFSSALTVLKQEPQTDQLKDNQKHTGCITKIENKPIDQTSNNVTTKKAHNLNGSPGSPVSTGAFEQISRYEKSGIVTGHDNLDGYAADKNSSRKSPVVAIQPPEIAIATSLSDDHKFQYILAAATSIATKNNEETLTYLNQGQSYEIKLKKTGDLSFYRDKILKSVIKICFHERRLQYMEREQMQQWQASRPGERIIEVDVPLSYGLCNVSQPLNSNFLNIVEVFWDPLKEVGVYIKVNCISTEFTPKKHGGEKGVPFRLQIETYIENSNSPTGGPTSAISPTLPGSPSQTVGGGGVSGNLTPNTSANGNNQLSLNGKQPVHAAACQIKVFKLKGADRKHKQDREKIQKRSQLEQDKFQPSYECTIMNDLPLELITPTPGCYSPEYIKVWPNSPVHVPKYDGIVPYAGTSPTSNSSPIAINSVTSSNSPTLKLMDTNMVSPQQVIAATADIDDCIVNIMPDATPTQVTQWLSYHRLTAYLSTFAHFSGADIMRMSKEDLIQICGLADGIRMFNILRAKVIAPRLTIYVSMDGSSYNAIYLISNTAKELTQKLYKLPGFYDLIANHNTSGPMENGSIYNGWGGGMHTKYSGSGSNIFNDATKSSCIYISGPSGVHVNVTDEVLNNEIKDGSLYGLEVQNGKVVMKLISKNDN